MVYYFPVTYVPNERSFRVGIQMVSSLQKIESGRLSHG
jgi:hypothetical protein